MWVSDRNIDDLMESGEIFIARFNEGQLNPNSYDVRLGNWFIYLSHYEDGKPHYSDFWSMVNGEKIQVPSTGVLLATTNERIGARGCYASELRGKSSIARRGIDVGSGTGIGEPGYYDQFWTATLTTNTPNAVLTVGEPIAQIIFHELTSNPYAEYSGQYVSDDWPYVMIPKEYRSRYKNILYERNNRVIICSDEQDPTWKKLIVKGG